MPGGGGGPAAALVTSGGTISMVGGVPLGWGTLVEGE